MLTVILMALIATTVLCIRLSGGKDTTGWIVLITSSSGLLIMAILAFACCVGMAIEGQGIDERIAMYQEENTEIENQIDALVTQYMEYEQNTYADLKSESSITLVSMYPELKSDALVSQQCELYMENNAKIKELKEDKINIKIAKWWLFFGE